MNYWRPSNAARWTPWSEELALDPEPTWITLAGSHLEPDCVRGRAVVVMPFVAIASAGMALFLVGATIGLLNGTSALRCGGRQLLLGGGAAVAAFIIGHLTRVGVGA